MANDLVYAAIPAFTYTFVPSSQDLERDTLKLLCLVRQIAQGYALEKDNAITQELMLKK